MRFNKKNYILSFWAQGVSVFVTDIHVDAYKELEVLLIIDNGMFKQYFTKTAYEKALDIGLDFYASDNLFESYRKDLMAHCDTFREFFCTKIEDKPSLSKTALKAFFTYTIKLCKNYTWMNSEHTDKAFSQQEDNPTIKANLAEVAKYKDMVRTYMNEVLFEPDGYVHEVFKILEKQFSLEQNIFEDLTQKEILDLYEDKRTNIEAVSNRQRAFVINFNRSCICEGRTAERILQRFQGKVKNSNVVIGKTASLGKVVGRVKVINVDYTNLNLLYKDIEKMNQGDILVAETTAPELIVACKKASAIVTDIGGLLSHAAIVSREFGIPCIVGTESATRMFKDGDVVEVDARLEKGVVTKLFVYASWISLHIFKKRIVWGWVLF